MMFFSCTLNLSYTDFVLEADVELDRGDLLTLLGPSGCGKTTFLRAVAGLEQPLGQKIDLDGKDISSLPAHRRNIGFVFQDYALFPHMNVYDNIAYGPKMRGWPGKEIEKTVRENLKLAGLSGFEKRNTAELSGGEKQRVALARALAPRPGLLLLDEPLSALDKNTRQHLRKQIRLIQKEIELTTIYVTHDQEEALSISDKIAVMREGRVEQFGTPQDIFRRPATPFAASFTGDGNILPDPEGGPRPLFFRAGSCGIVRPEGGDYYEFSGTVEYIEYRGDYYSAEMREQQSGENMTFHYRKEEDIAAGGRMTVFVPTEHVTRLSDEPDKDLHRADHGA